MKKTIKLAVVAALALGSTSAFATNGDHMMALGAKATAMGGVGIATAFGAESSLANVALIRGNEVSFGGTLFMPDVEFQGKTNNPMDPSSFQASDADLSVIPSVGFVQNVTENFTWGLGMYGTAGMGVDYRDDVAMYNDGTGMPGGLENAYMGAMNGTNQMSTALQIMKFTLPLAYRMDGLSLGIAPVIQYGALGMSYNNGAYTASADGMGGQNYNNVRTGSGTSDDLGFGFEVGLAYEISGITLGAVYKSAIDMEYANQISEATQNFGLQGYSDNLEQPAEIGVGVSYTFGGNTVALDYKNIAWSAAKGYEDFGWEDQDVIAIGYEYKAKSWAIRLGYNHSNNPVVEHDGSGGLGAQGPVNYEGAVLNYFNLAGFPAIIEQHYTFGASYNLSEKMSLDFAYVYSPEVSESFDTSAMTQGQMLASGMNPMDETQGAMINGTTSSANVNHSQSAVTIAANIAF